MIALTRLTQFINTEKVGLFMAKFLEVAGQRKVGYALVNIMG